ncbi:ABC-type transporter, ATP-binding protein (ATPase) [Desulfamplus magnetovallimortis]|uniref:ABC-type transporter, ATP-binding protein (ATPase) n=1 Tax=Desulfamplus magnetovallimortis TaxID=1246637 RepID=A0A1W1H6H9_9BACT|nr:ATP-binding cassette domain-containing protein [Desulfamplus magnetovallimortis]SLM28091.1 ABC-type transporter, ATP-binding protein (ATPase) [Desulfamplus magnetovallimortis]
MPDKNIVMIQLKNINKTFNPETPSEKQVIKDICLDVKKGDFITVIGSNGAGKSTLFNLISGNIMPSSGKILLGGEDVTKQPEYKRASRIGRIFQDPLAGTASNMTIEDNMMITFKKGFKWPLISLNRKMKNLFKEEIRQLDMELEKRMQENVSSLSGGQRQALTLLMTVLSNPDILLLDEHTAALDPRNAAIVMELTRKFIQEKHLTTLMVTHNMTHAIEFGNRLVMMDGGEIIIDIREEEKAKLTVKRLIEMFGEIRKKEFENDEVLLA